MSSNPKTYRPDVDGLRTVAVLSVVFCHAGLSFSGGFVGVDVFFVISGYLIAGLILKELKQGTFTLTNFWERRIRRIVPALLVVTVFTLVAGFIILMPDDYKAYGKSLVGLMLLASNVQFWRDIDYFASNAEEKPLLHTWSLSVEEQFYIFVPLFLLLLARKSHLHRAFVVLAIAAVLSFGFSVYGAMRYPSATFYLLPTRAWELFAGALLAFSTAKPDRKTTWRTEVIAVLGVALILIPCFIYNHETSFPGLTALPPVLGTVLLIWSGSFSAPLPIVSRILAARPMVFIGLISYSLYLWHWPLFSFARYISIKPIPVHYWVVLIGLSFICAIASWRFVETPFRTRQLFPARPRLFGVTGLAFAGLLGCGVMLYRGNLITPHFSEQTAKLVATGKFDMRYVHELEAEHVPQKMARFGATNQPPQLLVWGDSHAMAILPTIEALSQESGVSVVAATHAATAPVLDYFCRNRWSMHERAVPFNIAVMDYIKGGNVRSVLLVGCWRMYAKDRDFQPALEKTIDQLLAAKVSVYLMREVPTYEFNVSKALVRFSYQGRDLSQLGVKLSDYEAEESIPKELRQRMEARGVRVLEPLPILLARSKSPDFLPYDDGGSFYYDHFHLSTYGALALKPLLAPVVQSVGKVVNMNAQ